MTLRQTQAILTRNWENVITVPGTHKIHLVQTAAKKLMLKVADILNNIKFQVVCVKKLTISDHNDDNHTLTSASESDTENFIPLLRYTQKWRSLKVAERSRQIYNAANNVVKYINPARAVENRGQFVFEEL